MNDDELGKSVMARLVSTARESGLPRPALVAIHSQQVEQFDFGSIRQAAEPHRTRMIASILGRPELECGVFAGTMNVERRGQSSVRGLVVYIEWPDNRWWTAWQPVGPLGQPADVEPAVRRAVDGWPMPRGVGGWFSRVRREGLRLRVQASSPVAQPGLELVH
ncbi:MAG TPA: hypothetical protein DFR83_04215 [Deltaproteobacteria bacterium]|nr:hypothetical protein [Deltaproteobacteria bacterium]